MNSFENKIYHYIEDKNLVNHGSHIVVGVSGGSDSVGLLIVLASLKDLLGIHLTAVHVNHGLRGAQADEDQAYTQQLCHQMGIECRCFCRDIARMARDEHMTEEEAGRNYRYRCFLQVMREAGADAVAVAHHMDDTAETVLMNLLRGSGIRGLAGIRPKRDEIIRPLLCVTKQEIEDYLKEKQISWRTDATNLETDHTRNKIRNELLPYLNEAINPAAAEHLANLSWLMADVSDYLERQAQAAMQRYVTFNESAHIDLAAFSDEDIVIQREMLRQVIRIQSGKLKDIHLTHIENIRKLSCSQVGSQICLPYHLRAVKGYETLEIQKNIRTEEKKEGTCPVQALKVPGRYRLSDDERTLILSEFSTDKKGYFPKKPYTKWFDYDKICVELELRTRRQGDYMVLSGGGKKQLRRIMLDDKIPAAMRDCMPLLASGDQVLWLIGTDRISESVKVTEDTEHILCVELEWNR